MQQHVAKSKAGVAPARTLQVQQVLPQMSQKCSPASSNLRHQSGCLMSQAMHPVECLRLRLQKPKHQRHHLQETESQRAKSPRPATPKAESPRRAAPKAKADTPKAAAKATTEEPAQKAARTSEPKSVPVAKSPAAPPAAKVMQQTACTEDALKATEWQIQQRLQHRSHMVRVQHPSHLARAQFPRRLQELHHSNQCQGSSSRFASVQDALRKLSKARFSATSAD